MADTCIFCEIAAGRAPARTVYEDDEHLAFFPLEHINPGHLLLIPRGHTDYLFDLDGEAYRRLWDAAARLAPGLRAATGAKRIGVAVEGFSVPHVHVHLVPISAFDELNPSRARRLDPAAAEDLQQRIRAALAKSGAARGG
jgi:histidine triad (HIT) family protein